MVLNSAIKKTFPLPELLFLFQQSEYRSWYFLRKSYSRMASPLWRREQKIDWTPKLKLLAFFSLLFAGFFLASLFFLFRSSFEIFSPLVALIVFFSLARLFLPISIILSAFAIAPIEALVKFVLVVTAHRHLSRFKKTRIIGITGSVGKSTTRHALVSLLMEAGKKVATPPGNINTELGIARFIHSLREEPDYLVLEMGAYRRGEIARLCSIAPPHVSIITAIGSQHLEQFGSLEAIALGKAEIFAGSRPGAALYAYDGITALSLLKKIATASCKGSHFTTYGSNDDSDIVLSAIATSENGVAWDLALRSGETFHLTAAHFFGEHMALALSAAAVIALDEGVLPATLSDTLKTLTPLSRRMSITSENGITLINDSYNISPESARAALTTAQGLAELGNHRLVVVTGGIVEQGRQSAQENIAWGKTLGQTASLIIVARTEYLADLNAGLSAAREENFSPQVMVSSSPEETQTLLATHSRFGDVILLQNELPDIYRA